MSTSSKIDFVMTWIDESDSNWIEKKRKYSGNYATNLNSEARYRDWGFLRYWFRAVEEHAPWVNKVYFITEGHLPNWINKDYEKLVVIKHSDYINEKYLPTFNSNVIELNLSNIKGLSDNFVSFNDDMFLNADVTPGDFFKNNIPRDMGVFSPVVPAINSIDSIVLKNVEIINEYFNIRKVLKKNPSKYFNIIYGKHLIKNFCVLPWNKILGFYDNHIPISYKKSTFDKVWQNEQNIIEATLNNRFRTSTDISHWLMRYWQICEGDFVPRKNNFGEYYSVGVDTDKIVSDIKLKKHKVICINDNDLLVDFETTKESILTEFRRKYDRKSQFEK